jgi:hypothetical protein
VLECRIRRCRLSGGWGAFRVILVVCEMIEVVPKAFGVVPEGRKVGALAGVGIDV